MGDFTREAEEIIQGAKVEARNRHSYCVEDVDILTSLLNNDDGRTGSLIRNLGINYSVVSEKTEKHNKGDFIPTDAPWTIDAQNVLNEARKTAKELCHFCCGVEHLLIGLLRVKGMAARIFYNPDYTLRRVFAFFGKNIEEDLMRVHIRWMIRRDMPEVLAIEAECRWSEEDFIRCLRQRNCIGMVAEHDDRVVGFMIYKLNKTHIHVLNFAVARDSWRRGIGSQMVAKLVGKLSTQRRSRITLEVGERNLAAQLFFHSQKFRAISVLRQYYDDTPEDAYLMQYTYRPEKQLYLSASQVEHLAR